MATHETLDRIDIVDLNYNVLQTAPEFSDTNNNVVSDPRVRLFCDDGRNFLKVTHQTYDLITSEPGNNTGRNSGRSPNRRGRAGRTPGLLR